MNLLQSDFAVKVFKIFKMFLEGKQENILSSRHCERDSSTPAPGST